VTRAGSEAAFVVGPDAGRRLIDSFDGMSGAVTCRNADGGIGVAMSRRLNGAHHPVR
jgi:hypothetical protein